MMRSMHWVEMMRGSFRWAAAAAVAVACGAAAVVVGCGGARSSGAGSAAPTDMASTSATAPAEVNVAPAVPEEDRPNADAGPVVEEPVVQEVASIEPLGTVACRVGLNGKGLGERVRVRVTSGGKRWGYFQGLDDVFVELPPSGAKDGRAVGKLGGVELYGVVDADDFILFRGAPRKDGVIVPNADVALTWVGMDGSRPRVGTPASGAVQPAAGGRFEWADDCGALSLVAEKYDPVKALRLHRSVRKFITTTDPFTMSQDAAGAGAVELRTGSDVEVYVLGKKGKRTRIWIPELTLVLVGWVDSALLSAKGNNGLGLAGAGRGYGTGYGIISSKRLTCPDERSITLRMDGREWRVGRMAPGTQFQLDARDGVQGHLRLLSMGLRLEKGAELWMNVAGCGSG